MTPRTFAAWWDEVNVEDSTVQGAWNAALTVAGQAVHDVVVEELPGADRTLERILGAIRALRAEGGR